MASKKSKPQWFAAKNRCPKWRVRPRLGWFTASTYLTSSAMDMPAWYLRSWSADRPTRAGERGDPEGSVGIFQFADRIVGIGLQGRPDDLCVLFQSLQCCSLWRGSQPDLVLEALPR